MIATLTFLALLAVPTLEQSSQESPVSPCPNVFRYEPPGTKPGRWYGQVNIFTNSTLHSLWLNIVLDSKAIMLENWVGDVTTQDNIDFKIENSKLKISPGSPLAVRFFVRYNPLNVTPKLQKIRLNGKDICNVDKPNEPPGPVFIKPAVSPSPLSIDNDDSINLNDGQIDFITPVRVGNNNSNRGQQAQCGTVLLNTIPLVVNGIPALEGQWPWHIALYQTTFGNIKFICGGTLVSHRHIITAAHCITRTSSRRVVNQDFLTVYLGGYKLGTWAKGLQVGFVDGITVHPEYNPINFSKDLGILELREPVKYSEWVRPACLWPENEIDLNNIVGKKGSVVGWGFDETGMITEQLNLAVMPVVDQLTCIRSSEFFRRRTSDFTFCAGYRNGTSVCNGDSGGGMVFRNGNIWYLRGVVSLSAARENDSRLCDPTQYVIFTDLAQFLPWIKQHMKDF